MGFLSNFRANVTDLARAYLFYIKIDRLGVTAQKYLVRSSNLPGSSIPEIAVPYQGMTLKLGSTQEFDTWTCTFNTDRDMLLRNSLVS
jgi:hypothetical protein